MESLRFIILVFVFILIGYLAYPMFMSMAQPFLDIIANDTSNSPFLRLTAIGLPIMLAFAVIFVAIKQAGGNSQ